MPRNPTLVPRAILPSVASAGGQSHHPPPLPPAVSAKNWTKSLKDPVRGAGSAQVQIRSYCNRQSGNLARKVRNAFPMCKALKRHPWTPMKMLQLAMNSKCLKYVVHSHYSSLLVGISLEKSSASPRQNYSATATITVKPERLAHCCVGQDLLYPWMYYTSWCVLHRRQDERFSAPSLVNNFTFAVSDS